PPSGVAQFQAQVLVTGHTTDPVVFGNPNIPTATPVAPPVTFAVQTNDPSFRGLSDRANAPAGFGFRTDEFGIATGTAIALVGDASGRDDDDPTIIPVGQPPAGAPTILAPAALGSSLVGTRI